MLLAEGSKHCCQGAWANAAAAAEPWLAAMRGSICDRAALGLLVGVLQSPEAGCWGSMSGRQGTVAILCSPVPAD